MAAYVYVVKAGPSQTKIGSSSNVKSRMSSMQSGNIETLALFGQVKCTSRAEAFRIEKETRQHLNPLRERGEWFRVSPRVALQVLTFVHEDRDLKYIPHLVEAERLFGMDKSQHGAACQIMWELQRHGKWPFGGLGSRLKERLDKDGWVAPHGYTGSYKIA